MTDKYTDRFWNRVDTTGECWTFMGCLAGGGYGQFWIGKRLAYAHRFAYEVLRGPIPKGKQLDHLCRNRSCVRPSHLEVVSQEENLRRGISPPANNGRKTHCNYGHEFSPANTRYNKSGWRYCRACSRRKSSAYYHNKTDKRT